MNCRAGDLALVTWTADAGKLVTCLRLEDPPVPIPEHARGKVWLIDRETRWYGTSGTELSMPYCPDEFLMPIRPDAAQATETEALAA